MNSPEELQSSPDSNIEVQNSAANRLEQLQNSPEKSSELSERDIESKIEKARNDALEKASNAPPGEKEARKSERKSSSIRRGAIGKKELNKSYKQTLKQVQSELSTGNRIFSKIIHNGVIEKTSDIVSNTIARPNAILFGAISAFFLTLITYTTAKTIGYPLSGSETIITFAIGWLLGVIYDYLRILFTGNK